MIIITLIEHFRFIKCGVKLYLKNNYGYNKEKLVFGDSFLFICGLKYFVVLHRAHSMSK